MPRWIITNDQGFEATLQEAKDELKTKSEELGQSTKLWKLTWEASVENNVTLTRVDD